MPILEKGCGCCCELATCVKVQGIVFTSAFLVGAVLDAVFLARWVVPKEQDPGPHVDEEGRRFIGSKYCQFDPIPRNHAKYVKLVCAGIFLCLLGWAFCGLLLLYGVYKGKRMFLWPYMALGGTKALVITAGLVYYAASVHSQIPNLLIVLVFLGFELICLAHVVSLFQKMGEREPSVAYEEQA